MQSYLAAGRSRHRNKVPGKAGHRRSGIRGFIITLVAAPRPVVARSTLATLTGVVADEPGAVVPGAAARDQPCDEGSAGLITTTAGEYQAANLDPGSYRVFVQLSGFADATRDVDFAGAAGNVDDARFRP
jgi:Carboxypeptidase regulatory-like domain